MKNLVLLFGSLFFYAWGEAAYLPILILSAFVDYTVGRLLAKYESKVKLRKLFLSFSLIGNLGLLALFKYADFFIGSLNHLFSLSLPEIGLSLPLGISFFTFQTLSYSLDVYRHQIKAEKSFLAFLTYVTMFPQLIAGPIVRYQTIAASLKARTMTFAGFTNGLFRFMSGLFKKVLLANTIGQLWEAVACLKAEEMTFLLTWPALIARALQIYFDFSGYSAMAIGLGQILGFTYPENFNYPYIAKSIREFWQRWHITLSSFFRDYVYFPLGGSYCRKSECIRNLLVTWFLTGLWHGAAGNFILWGLYFGCLLILEKYVLRDFLQKRSNFFQHIYALFFILIGWAIFSINDVVDPQGFILTLFGLNKCLLFDAKALFLLKNYGLLLAIGMLFAGPFLQQSAVTFQNKIRSKPLKILSRVVYDLGFITLFILTVAYLLSDSYNPFLYFRF